MKKYFLILTLITVMLTAVGCQNSIPYVKTVTKLPSYEKYTFKVSKNENNKPVETGTAEYIVSEESYEATGAPAYKISAQITSEGNVTKILSYLSANTAEGELLKPLYTEKEYTPKDDGYPWKLTAKYDNAKCTIKADYSASGKEASESVDVPLSNTYLDNETLVLAIRSIDPKPGYTGLLNIIVPQYGKSESVRITVDEKKEKIVAYNGTFDCRKVTIKANTMFASDSTATVCYLTDDNTLVRINQGPYIYELTDYTQTK